MAVVTTPRCCWKASCEINILLWSSQSKERRKEYWLFFYILQTYCRMNQLCLVSGSDSEVLTYFFILFYFHTVYELPLGSLTVWTLKFLLCLLGLLSLLLSCAVHKTLPRRRDGRRCEAAECRSSRLIYEFHLASLNTDLTRWANSPAVARLGLLPGLAQHLHHHHFLSSCQLLLLW